jgi:hypothetical protein
MLQRIAFLSLLLLPFPCAAQQDQQKLPPRLIAADMPYYPPIAEAVHIAGWVKVRVTVEQGKVVQAEVMQAEARDNHSHLWKGGVDFLNTPTLTYVKTWRFSTDVNTSFFVKFTYNIAGPETDEPATPMIEVLPSLDVNITTRPFKPVVEY